MPDSRAFSAYRRFNRLTVCLFALLCATSFFSGCSKPDAQAALEKTARELQSALEAKDSSAALKLLHKDFAAPSSDNGQDWAKRTMQLVFLRYQHVRIVVLSHENQIDPRFPDRATSKGEIALLGAEGLVSGNASRIKVRLGWIKEDAQWKLARLDWE